MSILDRLTGRNKGKLSPNATFRLTQQGKEKLMDFSGDPKSRVLVALDTRGTSNLAEIAESSGLSKGQTEMLLPGLVRAGYIQYVSASNVTEE